MKRILSLIFLIIIITGLLPTLKCSAFVVSGDFEYIVFNEGYFWEGTYIVSYIGTAEDIVIPNIIDGHEVTAIGHPGYASYSIFKNNKTIKSVTISDGITRIWNGALSDCDNLTTINMPNSITHIGVAAFQNCPKLKSITIPSGVEELGKSHYPENNPNYSYKNLFTGCTNLTSIIVDKDNVNYASDEQGILYSKNKTTLLICPAGKTGFVKIPDSVTEIFDEAFIDCVGLSEITLPQNIKTIGKAAFKNCSHLTSFTIPNGAESIGFGAFIECTNLSNIAIPGSVKTISGAAFENLSNLKTVTMEYGVENIEYQAFKGCTNLESINLPDSITSIGNYAFEDCVSLTELIIPDSVTSIAPMCVFENCTNLTNVKMSDNVK